MTEGTIRVTIAEETHASEEHKAALLSQALSGDKGAQFAVYMLHCRQVQALRRLEREQKAAPICPKIPQGYGVDPGDCACGNCPEAKGGI